MKKTQWECLDKFFSGKTTDLDAKILQTLDQTDSLTAKIVRHYFGGGSYKAADFLFFVSKSTYYYRIKKFIKMLGKSK